MHSLTGSWLNRLCDPVETTLGEAVRQALEVARCHPELVDVFLARLRVEAEPFVVDRLLELLGAITPAERIQAVLKPFVESEDLRVRSKASKLYAYATGDAQWAMQFLGHDDPRVTANIVEALGGARSTPELKDFFWAAAGSPNGRVAGNAVIGLFQIGEPGAADVLRRLCRHEAPSVRASAAWVIGTVGWIEGMDVALEMTRDPNPKVQRDALQAVRRLQSLAGSSGPKVLNAGGGYR
jgi:HEAT repeat protein